MLILVGSPLPLTEPPVADSSGIFIFNLSLLALLLHHFVEGQGFTDLLKLLGLHDGVSKLLILFFILTLYSSEVGQKFLLLRL